MPASASYDYSVDAAAVIEEALQHLLVLIPGETIDSDDQSTCLRTLNLIVKRWQGKSDQNPGFKVWQRKRIYMFLNTSQEKYSLGPSGDRACEESDFFRTTLSALEAAGQTAISITSGSGIANNDVVGIVQDNNTIHWSTVSSGGGTTTINIAAATTYQASAGNQVFAYTSVIPRPLEILQIIRRNSNQEDTPMIKYESFEDYEAQTNKYNTEEPVMWWYEAQLDNGVLRLNGYPDDVSDYLRATVLYPADDMDSVSNTFAFPQDYFSPLSWQLAKEVHSKFGKRWTPEMQSNYADAMIHAQNVDPQNVVSFFQPNADGHA